MASLRKEIPHCLSQDEAARRIRERISSEKINKANVVKVTKEVWIDPYNLDFAMTIFNYRIDGSLGIGDSTVALTLNLPMGASVFKGVIEEQISQQMNTLLN
ncbi:MAG: polyhydroxyalkanoic acid system family protein [Planctomycetia bacterium]|nr:polyhydroxyalkanoic acid system family protein [Planctomycetia bacterium]